MEPQRPVALATKQSAEEMTEAIQSDEEGERREDGNQECHWSFL